MACAPVVTEAALTAMRRLEGKRGGDAGSGARRRGRGKGASWSGAYVADKRGELVAYASLADAAAVAPVGYRVEGGPLAGGVVHNELPMYPSESIGPAFVFRTRAGALGSYRLEKKPGADWRAAPRWVWYPKGTLLENPRGWTAAQERRYRAILKTLRARGRYRGRQKEVAARIVNARANHPRKVKRELRSSAVALLDRRLGTAIMHAGRAVHHATKRRNPPLPVRTFTGKSGHLVSEHVLAIDYQHAASAQRKPYRHDFGGGVELWALRDGSLLLRGGHGQRLWEDFYVRDGE